PSPSGTLAFSKTGTQPEGGVCPSAPRLPRLAARPDRCAPYARIRLPTGTAEEPVLLRLFATVCVRSAPQVLHPAARATPAPALPDSCLVVGKCSDLGSTRRRASPKLG